MDHVSKKPKLADGEDAMDVDDKENRKIAKVAFDETHMRIYYDSLFPAEFMMKWLAYGNDLKHSQADTGFMREFCFTLPGDVFVRYQSFKDDKELARSSSPSSRARSTSGPCSTWTRASGWRTRRGRVRPRVRADREGVRDGHRHDRLRRAHVLLRGGHLPQVLAPMDAAVKVIDKGLRATSGSTLLWVYSGRRGIHCWVCDKRASSCPTGARGGRRVLLRVQGHRRSGP